MAERLLAARYPDAGAAFAAGSFVRGGATTLSDLDIVVLHASLANAWRESFVFEGVPVDAFIHDARTLRAFLRKDIDAGKPAMLSMVIEGAIVGPSPETASPLKAEAEAIYANGPPPLDKESLDQFRYLISDRIGDLQDARPWSEMLATGAWLHPALADFILRANGRWGATAKWIPRALRSFDPELEVAFSAAFENLFERRNADSLIAFAEQALLPFGGFLFEGYCARAPLVPKG